MKLFELTTDLRNLEQMAEEGGQDELMVQALKDLGELHTEKALAVACFTKNLAAEVDAFKAEEARLKARRQAKENALERIKTYLAENLKPGEKIESPFARISWRKSSVVVIDDQAELPQEFIKTEIVYSPKKAEIKDAIKAGQPVPGARVESRENIQIS